LVSDVPICQKALDVNQAPSSNHPPALELVYENAQPTNLSRSN
jgi:hypothetical protein